MCGVRSISVSRWLRCRMMLVAEGIHIVQRSFKVVGRWHGCRLRRVAWFVELYYQAVSVECKVFADGVDGERSAETLRALRKRLALPSNRHRGFGGFAGDCKADQSEYEKKIINFSHGMNGINGSYGNYVLRMWAYSPTSKHGHALFANSRCPCIVALGYLRCKSARSCKSAAFCASVRVSFGVLPFIARPPM